MVDTLFLVPLQIYTYVVGLTVCRNVWKGARSRGVSIYRESRSPRNLHRKRVMI